MNSQNTNSAFRLLNEFRAAFLKDLRSYFRYPAWFVGEFVSTPLWFFFFALGVTLFTPATIGASNQGYGTAYFFFGFIFIILFSTAVWGIGQSIRNEQMAGTLEQFLLAPVSRITLIIGRWARVFLTDVLIVSYTALILYFLGSGPIPILDPPLFLFSLGLFELGIIGFGLLFAGLTLRMKSYQSLSNFIFFGYMILAGPLFPITVIPVPVRYVSMLIPFTYFNDLMRHAALATTTFLPESLELILGTVVAVSMFVVGLIAFRMIEQQARVKGTIATS